MADKTPKAIEREQIRDLAKKFGMTQKQIKGLSDEALDALMFSRFGPQDYRKGGMVKSIVDNRKNK